MLTAAAPTKRCPSCRAVYSADALYCATDGTPLTGATETGADPHIGIEISGHIHVRELVGVGAMGRVYRAFQGGVERDVAVKILHRELSANPQLVARFHREAKVASKLQHPNVVHVHLAGQLPDGALYIAMEFLDGISLQGALAQAAGPLPIHRALHIMIQLSDAVGEAHELGIVHRDLKPENVMLVRRGGDPDTVKVLDFGIARFHWGEQSMATAAGLIFGTARYISPEGAQGEGVGPPGDVYSMATLLYQMLAGRTPFDGDQAVALLISQIHDPPPHLLSLPGTEGVPELIAECVMQNLAKRPDARVPDARAFGRALLEAARRSGIAFDAPGYRALLGSAEASGSGPSLVDRSGGHARLSPVDMRTAAAWGSRASPPDGIDERPSQSSKIAPAATPPPAAATVQWRPSNDVQAQLSTVGAEPVATPLTGRTVPAEGVAPPVGPSRVTSLVDVTLDDHTAHPPPVLGPPSRLTAGADEDDAEEPAHERRALLRGLVLVVGFFLMGALLAIGVWRWGGRPISHVPLASVDEYLSRATVAMQKKRWDGPPGDNVREITLNALARWPNDRRIAELRTRAGSELIGDALDRKFAGDLRGAVASARLAKEFAPDDETAARLVAQYEAEVDALERPKPRPPALAPNPVGTKAPSRQPMPPRPLPSSPPAPAPPTAATTRGAIASTPAKPYVGQSVVLMARLTNASGAPVDTTAEDPYFAIVGPGGQESRLPATLDEPGLYRVNFSFVGSGTFDISFLGKLGGTPVRIHRALVVLATPSPGDNEPSPAPSAKWL